MRLLCARPTAIAAATSQKLAALLPFNPGPGSELNLDLNNRNREDNGILKLDYHLSEKSNLVATYFIGDSVQTEEDTTVAKSAVSLTVGDASRGHWGRLDMDALQRTSPINSGLAITASGNRWCNPITIPIRRPMA